MRGELRPGGTEREWCDPDVLRRLRRASLARLRKEVEPVEQGALGAVSAGAGRGSSGGRASREALVPLQGLSLPGAALGRRTCSRDAFPGYRPEQLDQLCASGEVVWVGAGLERVALYFREDAPALGRPGALPPPEGRCARAAPRRASGRRALLVRPGRRDRARAGGRAACALGSRLGRRGDERRVAAVASAAGGTRRRGRQSCGPRGGSRAQRANAITATQGRWSLDRRALPGRARSARARRAAARAPGDRDP